MKAAKQLFGFACAVCSIAMFAANANADENKLNLLTAEQFNSMTALDRASYRNAIINASLEFELSEQEHTPLAQDHNRVPNFLDLVQSASAAPAAALAAPVVDPDKTCIVGGVIQPITSAGKCSTHHPGQCASKGPDMFQCGYGTGVICVPRTPINNKPGTDTGGVSQRCAAAAETGDISESDYTAISNAQNLYAARCADPKKVKNPEGCASFKHHSDAATQAHTKRATAATAAHQSRVQACDAASSKNPPKKIKAISDLTDVVRYNQDHAKLVKVCNSASPQDGELPNVIQISFLCEGGKNCHSPLTIMPTEFVSEAADIKFTYLDGEGHEHHITMNTYSVTDNKNWSIVEGGKTYITDTFSTVDSCKLSVDKGLPAGWKKPAGCYPVLTAWSGGPPSPGLKVITDH